MRLETSHQVNAHLNAEVETLTKQLDELREQNESYQRHMHDLAAMLAQERRHHASGSDQVTAWLGLCWKVCRRCLGGSLSLLAAGTLRSNAIMHQGLIR